MPLGVFSSAGITSKMSEWDTVVTVYPGNLDSYRTNKSRKSKYRDSGGSTYFATTNLSVQVGMSVIGMEELVSRFGAITANVREAAREILTESGTRLRTESQDMIPWRTGAMHDTWFPSNIEDAVYNDGDRFYLELGYLGTELGGVAYTWVQHEDGSLEHPIRSEAGRTRSEYKFLEKPADVERARLLATAMDRMHEAITRMGGVGVMPGLAVPKGLGTIAGPRLVKRPRG